MEVNRLDLFRSLVKSDKNLKRIQKLLSEGINPNLQDIFGNTPLHTAAESSQVNLGVVRELINAGADVNLENEKGLTPLHFAVIHKKRDLVKPLLLAGANVNAGTHTGARALHFAIKGEINILFLLEGFLEKPIRQSPDTFIIRMLLQQENIIVNAINKFSETPLMWAVDFRHPSIVKALLESRADPNICNDFGDSPLHKALYSPTPSTDIVHLLLKHGSDLCIKNNQDQTPIDILIDRIKDDQYLIFAKTFVKMASFHNSFSEEAIRNLERHPDLASLQQACSAELIVMKSQGISKNLTIRDFLLLSFNEKQFIDEYDDLCVELYKPLVDILITGQFSVYLHDILIRINKYQLYKVLQYNMSQKNELDKSHNIHILNLFTMIVNCELYVYLSHWEIFKIILSASNLDDVKINSIIPFGM